MSTAATIAQKLAAAATDDDQDALGLLLANSAAQSLGDADDDNDIMGRGGDDVFSGMAGDDTINGLRGNDTLSGGEGNDKLYGWADRDTLNGGEGIDLLDGGRGKDVLNGDNGADQLLGDRGKDTLSGGAGADKLYGGMGDDSLDGGAGVDEMRGGAGNDTYTVDVVGDLLFEDPKQGRDAVKAGVTWTLGADFENLELTGTTATDATGNALKNALVGNSGINKLLGMDGNDTLSAGGGADFLTGGRGNDVMTGGAGADTFILTADSIGHHERDRITDFTVGDGDLLNLTAIDANTSVAGDQAFTAVAELTGAAGQMALVYKAGITTLTLDVDGDGKADYTMKIKGDVTLHSGTWLL